MSVLNELINLNGRGLWTYYLSNQGYLRHLIESFTSENEQLLDLLNPEPDSLRALYAFESKMALLARLASTPAGAEILLESGLMLRLSEMTVFSARPDVAPAFAVGAEMETDALGLAPSPLERYHQILFPVLRICQSLLSSLGSENLSVTAQVRPIYFLYKSTVISFMSQ